MSQPWSVFSDYDDFNVRDGHEVYARRVFNEAKLAGYDAVLFCDITEIDRTGWLFTEPEGETQ